MKSEKKDASLRWHDVAGRDISYKKYVLYEKYVSYKKHVSYKKYVVPAHAGILIFIKGHRKTMLDSSRSGNDVFDLNGNINHKKPRR
jgi:hypothetical protein